MPWGDCDGKGPSKLSYSWGGHRAAYSGAMIGAPAVWGVWGHWLPRLSMGHPEEELMALSAVTHLDTEAEAQADQ